MTYTEQLPKDSWRECIDLPWELKWFKFIVTPAINVFTMTYRNNFSMALARMSTMRTEMIQHYCDPCYKYMYYDVYKQYSNDSRRILLTDLWDWSYSTLYWTLLEMYWLKRIKKQSHDSYRECINLLCELKWFNIIVTPFRYVLIMTYTLMTPVGNILIYYEDWSSLCLPFLF